MESYCNKKNRRGITFVEIVISLLLLSMVIGAVIGLFVVSRAMAMKSKHRILAVNLTRARIEAIKGLDFSQVPAAAGVEAVVIDEGAPDTGDEVFGQRSITVSDFYGDGAVYKIAAKVSWTEMGAGCEENVITLITRH
ncbi:MAG: prepilin-type N-terminal cleavage/methylation domain-containing protein [Candidatus Omnitrophica bacterium]|nr:prepilin-type N-terminal cleavage/methylation domain-containing protein [Candidatus Omnitrophota bacterium]